MTSSLNNAYQKTVDADKKSEFLTTATFQIENEAGQAVFSELAGISSEVEQAEYMEAGAHGPLYGRFIGKAKPPTVTLKRAMSTGKDTAWIWEWHAMAREAKSAAYRTTDLALYSAGSDSTDPVKVYTLTNAFPTKVEIAGMKAGGTEVVIQTVTLQCDEITELPK
jgi:phage tail-like protein